MSGRGNLIEINGAGLDAGLSRAFDGIYGFGDMRAGVIALDRATMAASGAAGAVVGRLSDPYGTGSTFATYGTVPGQLALSSGRIVKGSGAAVAGETYTIGIVATSADGGSSLRTPIAVTAV